MRRDHLERLRPVCPTCLTTGRGPSELSLGAVARDDGEDVLEGVLVCAHRFCRREHPIVDGIPIVVTDLRGWASHQLDSLLRRDDLTPFTQSVIGDVAPAGGSFERDRGNVSGYGHAHWATDDLAALLGSALDLLDARPGGVWADLGCGVGRGVLELARRTHDLTVGVELSWAMVRVAERVRREGRAVFARKRVGLVYDHLDLPVDDVPADRMSFWCCDVAALPFAAAVFEGALSLNVLDCAASPLGHLHELGRVLAPGAPALLTTPYDWSITATAVDQWLGGHSQRSESEGSSVAELRRILSDDQVAGVDTGLVIEQERDEVPWRVYANERSAVHYALHLLQLRRST